MKLANSGVRPAMDALNPEVEFELRMAINSRHYGSNCWVIAAAPFPCSLHVEQTGAGFASDERLRNICRKGSRRNTHKGTGS